MHGSFLLLEDFPVINPAASGPTGVVILPTVGVVSVVGQTPTLYALDFTHATITIAVAPPTISVGHTVSGFGPGVISISASTPFVNNPDAATQATTGRVSGLYIRPGPIN